MASQNLEPVNGAQNENYIFSNGGYAATVRLNFQYYLWAAQTGYQISPSIPLDKENLHIADLGTGTGIWLVELSRTLPASTTFHGLDLKTDLLPRSEWMPSNLTFHHLNAFEPVPEQYSGKYDIVHVRYFTPVVQMGDPSAVIKTAMQLLKPGGYLQWDERDLDMKLVGASSEKTRAMEVLLSAIADVGKNIGSDVQWVPFLDQHFKNCGLEIVSFERHALPRELLGYNQDLVFQTTEEGSYGLDRMQGKNVGNALREMVRAAYEEHRVHGTVATVDLVVCVGRKKL